MHLFKERVLRQWQTTFTFIHKMIDWVMWLYILIPGGAFSYFFLRETVFQGEYGILAVLRPELVVVGLLLLCSFCKSRWFVEQPDRIFLIQQEKVLAQLKRCGYWYAFIGNVLGIALLYSLLYWLFVHVHQFSIMQMLQLAISLVSAYVCCVTIDLLKKKWQRFILQVVVIVGFTATVFMQWSVMLLIVAVMGFIAIFIVEVKAIRGSAYFEQQVQLDAEAASRYQTMLFQMHPEMKGFALKTMDVKAPRLFKRPVARTKDGALVELTLKSLLRNRTNLWNYTRFVLIVIPLLFIVPMWCKWVLIGFFYLGIKSYVAAIVLEQKEQAIFKVIPYQEENWRQALQRLVNILVLPVVILFMCIVVVQWYI